MTWGGGMVHSTNYDRSLALSHPGSRQVTAVGGAEYIVRPAPTTDGVGYEIYIPIIESKTEEYRIGGWRRSSVSLWGWVPVHALNHWRVYESLASA